jgi:hypothetical protein
MWVFPLAYIRAHSSGKGVLAMDYNLCYAHDGCKTHAAYDSSTTDVWTQQTLDTYRQYFEESYTGNRAPIFVGNHFEMWHNGAYTRALAAFVMETCRKPEVRCVSYRELAEWLNTTPADQRASWQAGSFEHYSDPAPPAYGEPVPDSPRPVAVTD